MNRDCGWIIHYVFDEIFKIPQMDENKLVNVHTHGLRKKYQHSELQIVIPIRQTTAHSLLWILANKIKEGKTFSAGDISDEIIANYNISFINSIENGRRVLRMIIPDRNGTLNEALYHAQILDSLSYNDPMIIEKVINFNYLIKQ